MRLRGREAAADGLVAKKLRARGLDCGCSDPASERVLHFRARHRVTIAICRAAIPPHATPRFAARQSERGGRCFAKIAAATAMDLRRALRAFCSGKTFHRYRRTA